MTIIVIWQLRVTLDSIRNSCVMLGQNNLWPFSPDHPSSRLSSARLLYVGGGLGTHPKMSCEQKSQQQNRCSKKQQIATQSSKQIHQSFHTTTLDKIYLAKVSSPHRCAGLRLASEQSSSEIASDEHHRTSQNITEHHMFKTRGVRGQLNNVKKKQTICFPGASLTHIT